MYIFIYINKKGEKCNEKENKRKKKETKIKKKQVKNTSNSRLLYTYIHTRCAPRKQKSVCIYVYHTCI